MTGDSQDFSAPTAQATSATYKSPPRKLVKFFHNSHDQWKGKCPQAEAEPKKLKKKLRGGEARHQRGESRAHALEEDPARLHEEKRALEEAAEAGEKKAH